MMIKSWIFIIICYFSSIFDVFAQDLKIDDIKAIINDEIILNSDVDNVFMMMKKNNQTFMIPFRTNVLKEKILDNLIVETLILQQANRMNIVITKKQIDDVMQNIALQQNISIKELKKNLMINGYHNYINYLNNIEKLLKIKIVENYELHKRVHVSDQEINFLFKKIINKNEKLKRINLSYIFLPFSKNRLHIINNKKMLLEKIINNLKQGVRIEESYPEYKKNNKIAFVKKNFWIRFIDLQKNFSQPLNIVKLNQILDPILGKDGFYIFKINDIVNNKENIRTDFYVQHCLIKPSLILSDLEVKDIIFSIYNNIQSGVYSFDYAVKNFSHDVNSSNRQGNLGWVSKNFFKNYENIELLKKNKISKPIQSNIGWHIIKLLKIRQVDEYYSVTKRKAYNLILKQKIFLEKQRWIEDLKKFSYIKIIGF
ncbi:peptidylprolyl isomerase [Buchnera aphidicola (Hyadaphis tataricae)]|uniref:Peptidylprolyl isomerase n=2 Tax=Buchnera aphidicola TaxID=9 RepID=A0A4D6XYZ8_9GAMM|nr:peptidylprolyl isomerase [Buchnera aphidicola (Hyadaphis tataricae)]